MRYPFFQIFILVLSCTSVLVWWRVSTVQAATSVINNVSVSATTDSEGESKNVLRVHSVVDGQIIEDVDRTSQEPIQYHKQTVFTNGTTTHYVKTGTDGATTDMTRTTQLQALITQLLYYVSLLTQVLEAQSVDR